MLLLTLLFPSGGTAQTATDAELRAWLAEDSTTTCDHIGWSFADGGYLYDIGVDGDGEVRWPACVGSRGDAAACGTLKGDGRYFKPPVGQTWIACYIVTSNVGQSPIDVSMFDFSLVDGDGRKYTYDLEAQSSLSTRVMMPTTTLRTRQQIEGVVAFSVPKTAEMPLVLEIDPLLSFSLNGDSVAHIVIPILVPIDGLFS